MSLILAPFRYMRLTWRLVWDRRVPLILKMFIVGSLSYIALPFDIVKDFIPIVGRFDDLIILTIAVMLFVRLSPPQIVQEHRGAIWGTRVREGNKVVEADYKVLNDDDTKKGTS